MASEYDLYGDWPNYFHKKLQSDWVLSPTCRENCECYFLRHWETKHMYFQVADSGDWLEYLGNRYNIIFLCNPAELLAVDQCALSFRKPKPELNLPAYVLVKGISQ